MSNNKLRFKYIYHSDKMQPTQTAHLFSNFGNINLYQFCIGRLGGFGILTVLTIRQKYQKKWIVFKRYDISFYLYLIIPKQNQVCGWNIEMQMTI